MDENAIVLKQHLVDVAAGRRKADLVFKNAVYLNVFSNELSRGDIAVADGVIAGIGEDYSGIDEKDMSGKLLLPGFIDSHIHLESTLVSPMEFAMAVVPHGTTTVFTDPHEIANVMGTSGIEYMLQATEGLPVDVRFMLPSCVPATPLDESGADLGPEDIEPFYSNPRVSGLAEMMNYPGTALSDARIMAKLASAQRYGRVADGHAPGLSGTDLNAYIAAGVYSDHECTSFAEARDKLERGQWVMIREGTAAHNLEALLPLLTPKYADRCMFCTDDKHPDDLLEKGHIDYIIRRALAAGVDPVLAVKCATFNAARYFRLYDRGAIAPGYIADITVVDSFENFAVREVFKAGRKVYGETGTAGFCESVIDSKLAYRARSTFNVASVSPESFALNAPAPVVGMVPGEIITTDEGTASAVSVADDVLKAAVVERHKGTGHIGIGYIKGYGLTSGAVASSISHDSHNIIAVGTNDSDIAAAVNRIAELGGGIVVVENGAVVSEVRLSIAGLMSESPLSEVNSQLERTKKAAFDRGVSKDVDPFMTLSFISLKVVPAIRITTRGVYDVISQKYI